MPAILILGRDGMGEADEADFEAWSLFVCQRIDERCGFTVDMDERAPRGRHRRGAPDDPGGQRRAVGRVVRRGRAANMTATRAQRKRSQDRAKKEDEAMMKASLTNRTTVAQVAEMLDEDGYDPALASAVKRAFMHGCLSWTDSHLITTDDSRIRAYPRDEETRRGYGGRPVQS